MTTIEDILTELCKRGCMIEITNGYSIDHLPKSLVTINNDIIGPSGNQWVVMGFKVSPIVHNFSVYFTKHMDGIYESTWCKIHRNYITHYIDCSYDYNIIMEKLDFLTHYLYTEYNTQQQCIFSVNNLLGRYVSPDTIFPYTKNLKVKMISSLINDGILRYLQAIDNVMPIIEIKLTFINVFMKLDNWHNVGLYMQFGT